MCHSSFDPATVDKCLRVTSVARIEASEAGRTTRAVLCDSLPSVENVGCECVSAISEPFTTMGVVEFREDVVLNGEFSFLVTV